MKNKIELHLGDCLEIMPMLEADSVDAVITDPPYGIDLDKDGCNTRNKNRMIIGDDKPFDPTPFIEYPTVILWGANNYADKLPHGGWLAWDKRIYNDMSDLANQSDGELAWTNRTKRILFYRHLWVGAIRKTENGKHYHPTQKPIILMKWCLKKFTQEGDTILDPFMGSGTTGVACVQTGRNFIGIEIEPKYFEIAEKRIKKAQLQMRFDL